MAKPPSLPTQATAAVPDNVLALLESLPPVTPPEDVPPVILPDQATPPEHVLPPTSEGPDFVVLSEHAHVPDWLA
jgi:hypothetical protein